MMRRRSPFRKQGAHRPRIISGSGECRSVGDTTLRPLSEAEPSPAVHFARKSGRSGQTHPCVTPEQTFRILLKFRRNVPCNLMFYPRLRRIGMKKLGYIIAALGAIVIAAPSIASAETV